ncbi:hypothetical protein Tco_0621895 [Tanacetum coccineum]
MFQPNGHPPVVGRGAGGRGTKGGQCEGLRGPIHGEGACWLSGWGGGREEGGSSGWALICRVGDRDRGPGSDYRCAGGEGLVVALVFCRVGALFGVLTGVPGPATWGDGMVGCRHLYGCDWFALFDIRPSRVAFRFPGQHNGGVMGSISARIGVPSDACDSHTQMAALRCGVRHIKDAAGF